MFKTRLPHKLIEAWVSFWLDSEIELATGQLQDRTDTFITDGNVASPRVGSEGVDECANIPQRHRVRTAEGAARAGGAQKL
jgi:hypothetical protein